MNILDSNGLARAWSTLKTALAGKLDTTGNGSTVTITLPEVEPAGEIESGDTLSIIAAKTKAGLAKSASLNVVALDALPETATDRTIAVITDTPTEDIIVIRSEPVLVEGRIWVHIVSGADGGITESGESIIRPQRAYQAVGGLWEPLSAYYSQFGEWVRFSTDYTIMGYEWNYGNSSPLLTRLEAAEGLTATASVGTIAGHSDFDTMPIYRDIRRCNLAADGAVNAYEGDEGFTYDGSNGDVMVEIPKFWYKRTDDPVNKIQTFLIADKAAEGFEVYPLFDRGDGIAREKAYIGAYETGAAYTSKSGVAPLVSQTRAATRTGIRAKGAGWSIQDLTARLAVAELFRIEYATHNAQTAIGKGNSATTAALATGRTNSIAGHTGREAGTDGATSVLYRGIENPWGNVWEWVDGFNFNGGTLYYCLTQANFADDTATNYTSLSFTVGTALSASYGTAIGFDVNRPWAGVPSAFSGGSETTYLTDACWSSTGWRVAIAGGRWNNGGADGLACWDWYSASSYAGASVGSRLLYIPDAA